MFKSAVIAIPVFILLLTGCSSVEAKQEEPQNTISTADIQFKALQQEALPGNEWSDDVRGVVKTSQGGLDCRYEWPVLLEVNATMPSTQNLGNIVTRVSSDEKVMLATFEGGSAEAYTGWIAEKMDGAMVAADFYNAQTHEIRDPKRSVTLQLSLEEIKKGSVYLCLSSGRILHNG